MTYDDTIVQKLAALLQQTRQQKNYTVRKIAEHLKVAPKKIEALEAAQFTQFQESFLKGLIRSYAKYLQIGHEVDQLFNQIWQNKQGYNTNISMQSLNDINHEFKFKTLLWPVSIIAALLTVYFYMQKTQNQDPQLLKHELASQTMQNQLNIPNQASNSITTASTPTIQSAINNATLNLNTENNTVNTNKIALDTASSVVANTTNIISTTPNFSLEVISPTWLEIIDSNKKKIFSGTITAQQALNLTVPVGSQIKIANVSGVQKVQYNQKLINIQDLSKNKSGKPSNKAKFTLN